MFGFKSCALLDSKLQRSKQFHRLLLGTLSQRMTTRGIFLWTILLLLNHTVEGKLVFRSPGHVPRIYTSAPDGVHVTTVQAFDPQWPHRTVSYSLLDVRDRAQFAIDPDTGNLTTASTVHQDVGFVFHVLVAALCQGSTELRKMEIIVSEYNREAPSFQKSTYTVDLHIRSPEGAPVLTAKALDQDIVPYNAQVFYKLDSNASSSYFEINSESGQLRLLHSLRAPLPAMAQNTNPFSSGASSNLVFGVYAQDSGSPVRIAYAGIHIHVKNVSEPRDVRSANPTDTTVDVCWSQPLHGEAMGYLIKYKEQVSDGIVEGGTKSYLLNVTTNAPSECATIYGLRPWTDYQYQVHAWNLEEIGMSSLVYTMETKPNYCAKHVCKQGTCHPLNVEPGYWCECPNGYYGSNCEFFDACTLSPCQNFGSCRNTSHNEYECECLEAFSGHNCTHFNPCAVHPSPCLNGGQCSNTASHSYTCKCTEGFYGENCDNYNPCVSSPCANGAQCHNLSNEHYACACRPGFSGLNCEWNVDECSSSPCGNGATCVDEVNGFRCICPSGYQAHDCTKPVQCPREVTKTEKGVMVWEPTDHGNLARATCPFGYRPWQGTSSAKRRCRLLPSGEVSWAKVQDQQCREEAFYIAEISTEEMELMTKDPSKLTAAQIKEVVTKLMEVVELAAKDPKIAQNLFSVISNLMDARGSALEEEDSAQMILRVVDRFTSEVQLETVRAIEIKTQNIDVKVVSLDVKEGFPKQGGATDELTHALSFRISDPVAEKRVSLGSDNHIVGEVDSRKIEETYIVIPVEALEQFTSHDTGPTVSSTNEIRLKFVSYRNSRLFRNPRHSLENNYGAVYQCRDPQTGSLYTSKG